MAIERIHTYCEIDIIIKMVANMTDSAKKISIALIMYFTFFTSSFEAKHDQKYTNYYVY